VCQECDGLYGSIAAPLQHSAVVVAVIQQTQLYLALLYRPHGAEHSTALQSRAEGRWISPERDWILEQDSRPRTLDLQLKESGCGAISTILHSTALTPLCHDRCRPTPSSPPSPPHTPRPGRTPRSRCSCRCACPQTISGTAQNRPLLRAT
jgi:hypothetical protein